MSHIFHVLFISILTRFVPRSTASGSPTRMRYHTVQATATISTRLASESSSSPSQESELVQKSSSVNAETLASAESAPATHAIAGWDAAKVQAFYDTHGGPPHDAAQRLHARDLRGRRDESVPEPTLPTGVAENGTNDTTNTAFVDHMFDSSDNSTSSDDPNSLHNQWKDWWTPGHVALVVVVICVACGILPAAVFKIFGCDCCCCCCEAIRKCVCCDC